LFIDRRQEEPSPIVSVQFLVTRNLYFIVCRLKRRPGHTGTANLNTETGAPDHDFDFDTHIETGFQLATFQGPLCAEPVQGLAYFIENIEIDKDGVDKEIGNFAPRRAR
jgi:hypothetical protein